jgi:Family of unknown function (DUF5995)
VTVSSIPELLEQMAVLSTSLPPTDGVACFNRMYQLVTQSVQQHLELNTFGDPEWMERLDVIFGNLYLDAVADPSTAARAWKALFERRSDVRVTPLQFALAGLSAHINRDLPLAVVLTCAERDTTPDSGAHHADYERINTLLAAVEPSIRRSFIDGLPIPGLQDVVANFDLIKARHTAWLNAETLWALRQIAPARQADYLDGLDHLVGFAGRGLLVPLLGGIPQRL